MILDDRSGAAWRVIRGDSLLVLRDLPAESVDAVITDPPYSSGGQFRGDRQGASTTKYMSADSGMRGEYPEVEGDNRDQRAYLAWCSLWLAECLRACRDGAFVAMFTDWRQLPTTTDALQAGGFVWRGVAPWCKPTARPQKGRLYQSSEFVVWGSKGPLPVDRPCPTIIGHWIASAPTTREHMTEKPVDVMRDLAKMCVPGGTILDPFGGAATTGVAAILEGRRFLGIEVSPAYFDIACRRLAEVEAGAERGSMKQGQGALFGGAA